MNKLNQARAIEQFLISKKGLSNLENKINSVASARDIFSGSQIYAKDYLKNLGILEDLISFSQEVNHWLYQWTNKGLTVP